jgi:hypothetical protein
MHRTPNLVAQRWAGEHISASDLRKIYRWLCVCTLFTILGAGLWPFRAPKNEVEWLHGKNGLQFGHRGIVASVKAFTTDSRNGSCSLEVALQPARVSGSGTILAFDDFLNPTNSFALRQFDESLAIQRPGVEKERMVRLWWKTDRIFATAKPVVLTITSMQGKSILYVDGIVASSSSGFGLVDADLTGKLVLGNSMTRDNWPGQITGLAIYHVALTPSQVEENAIRWTRGLPPVANGERHPAAMYLFDERSGNLVHDQTSSGNSLEIPDRYFVMHPSFLAPVLDQYRSRWDGWMTRSYWDDVLLNVAGFVPLGFFFTAYLSLRRPSSQAWIPVLLFGFTISLAIETTQYFLPTRDSSMTDLLTNTVGTVVGVVLYRHIQIRKKIRVASS